MPSKRKPDRLTLRSYQVGFGDCFLLTFHYSGNNNRHILVDFGSTSLPKTGPKDLMLRVAKSIKEECEGKLHAVVATHRHRDHISGFATNKAGTASGDIIASCKPDVVVQPWTEDPKAQPDAKTSTKVSDKKSFVASLQSIHEVSEAMLSQINTLGPTLSPNIKKQLQFLGEDNLTNKSAVENLQSMGKRHFWVHHGTASGLESVLPGVKTRVLGPPDLKQTETIRKMRSKDKDQFWHLQSLAGKQITGMTEKLFPRAQTYSAPPAQTRWLIHRMQALRGDQMLEIVRALDDVMNNTSVILLFEAGKKKLLFPGDAQWENWEYALNQKGVEKLLADVDLYKVGHHGSLNATPKSMWNLFDKRSTTQSATRLTSVVSTMTGKHGDTGRGTEVPRSKLVEELKKNSNYHTTQDVNPKTELFEKLEFDLS